MAPQAANVGKCQIPFKWSDDLTAAMLQIIRDYPTRHDLLLRHEPRRPRGPVLRRLTRSKAAFEVVVSLLQQSPANQGWLEERVGAGFIEYGADGELRAGRRWDHRYKSPVDRKLASIVGKQREGFLEPAIGRAKSAQGEPNGGRDTGARGTSLSVQASSMASSSLRLATSSTLASDAHPPPPPSHLSRLIPTLNWRGLLPTWRTVPRSPSPTSSAPGRPAINRAGSAGAAEQEEEVDELEEGDHKPGRAPQRAPATSVGAVRPPSRPAASHAVRNAEAGPSGWADRGDNEIAHASARPMRVPRSGLPIQATVSRATQHHSTHSPQSPADARRFRFGTLPSPTSSDRAPSMTSLFSPPPASSASTITRSSIPMLAQVRRDQGGASSKGVAGSNTAAGGVPANGEGAAGGSVEKAMEARSSRAGITGGTGTGGTGNGERAGKQAGKQAAGGLENGLVERPSEFVQDPLAPPRRTAAKRAAGAERAPRMVIDCVELPRRRRISQPAPAVHSSTTLPIASAPREAEGRLARFQPAGERPLPRRPFLRPPQPSPSSPPRASSSRGPTLEDHPPHPAAERPISPLPAPPLPQPPSTARAQPVHASVFVSEPVPASSATAAAAADSGDRGQKEMLEEEEAEKRRSERNPLKGRPNSSGANREVAKQLAALKASEETVHGKRAMGEITRGRERGSKSGREGANTSKMVLASASKSDMIPHPPSSPSEPNPTSAIPINVANPTTSTSKASSADAPRAFSSHHSRPSISNSSAVLALAGLSPNLRDKGKAKEIADAKDTMGGLGEGEGGRGDDVKMGRESKRKGQMPSDETCGGGKKKRRRGRGSKSLEIPHLTRQHSDPSLPFDATATHLRWTSHHSTPTSTSTVIHRSPLSVIGVSPSSSALLALRTPTASSSHYRSHRYVRSPGAAPSTATPGACRAQPAAGVLGTEIGGWSGKAEPTVKRDKGKGKQREDATPNKHATSTGFMHPSSGTLSPLLVSKSAAHDTFSSAPVPSSSSSAPCTLASPSTLATSAAAPSYPLKVAAINQAGRVSSSSVRESSPLKDATGKRKRDDGAVGYARDTDGASLVGSPDAGAGGEQKEKKQRWTKEKKRKKMAQTGVGVAASLGDSTGPGECGREIGSRVLPSGQQKLTQKELIRMARQSGVGSFPALRGWMSDMPVEVEGSSDDEDTIRVKFEGDEVL